MDVPHPLRTLLQFLVTDASSIAHLSYILDHLSPSSLAPSPHLQKWAARVTSLMHSKDPAARWAAICIAYRMSFLSKQLLVDNAHSWTGIVISSLAKSEPIPILRVSMRYLTLVLCVAGHNPEFQRQVAIPMVPKVSSALLTIAEKHSDSNIKALSIQALAQLVPLYPSPHKALNQRLLGLCNQIFNGSIHHAMDVSVLHATANLYAVLHSLGGKVGGASLWRNYLDEVLQLSWSAWLSLRTTFPASAQLCYTAIGYLRSPDGKPSNLVLHADSMTGNPLTTIALKLDILKCGICAIGALLRAPVSRPVKLPIGHLAAFCGCLLASNLDEEGPPHFDPYVRAAESAVVGQIWMQACRLLSCLAETAQGQLAPHLSKLITIISSHLENNLDQSQRRSFLQCAYDLLYFCPVVGAISGVNRLLKAAILILSPLYMHQPRVEINLGATGQSRASKKRRREYDVDNVLSATNSTACTTTEECDTMITALDVIDQCMLNSELVPSTHSLASRVLLSILLSLPSMSPASLSFDTSFHGRVIRKVRGICIERAQGISHAMSKGTGIILGSFSSESLMARDKLHSNIDLLLHPRRPPFVRTLPFVECFSMSSAEESAEETATRKSLDLVFGDGDIRSISSDRKTYPNSVGRISLALDPQTSACPSQEPALPIPVELPLQVTKGDDGNFATITPSIFPTGSPLPNIPTSPPLSTSEKGAISTVCVASMLVDESDQEEVPAIDLGSDSDA